MRRSTSAGMSATSASTMITAPATAAGTIVPPAGLSPGSTPVRSSTPKSTSAPR